MFVKVYQLTNNDYHLDKDQRHGMKCDERYLVFIFNYLCSATLYQLTYVSVISSKIFTKVLLLLLHTKVFIKCYISLMPKSNNKY